MSEKQTAEQEALASALEHICAAYAMHELNKMEGLGITTGPGLYRAVAEGNEAVKAYRAAQSNVQPKRTAAEAHAFIENSKAAMCALLPNQQIEYRVTAAGTASTDSEGG